MSKVAKATIGLMIVTMISKVLGLGRELVLGTMYGASNYSDIYITTLNITQTLFTGIGATLITTFIPLYYENQELGGENRANKFANNIFNTVLICGIFVCLIGCIFAKPLVKVFAIGFDGNTLATAVKFTKVMIFGGIFIGINNIVTALLQIKGNFTIPGISSLPFNLVIIISIILSVKLKNIYILPIGTLIAMASQVLFQYPFAHKEGYKYKLYIDPRDVYVRRMLILIAPIFIGVAVDQINTMVDRTLASTLVEGSISALNYANRLNGFVIGLFILSIGSVIYPVLSKLSLNDDKYKFMDTIVTSVNSVILLTIPISVGAIVLATPIVKLIFQRGAFDERATVMTSTALVFYAIGIVGFGIREILNKVFYSLQDTKTPMINGIITVILNIVINLILVRIMGHGGLALATSIAAIICTILLIVSLKKNIGSFGQERIIKTLIKSLISALIMGVITIFVYKGMNNTLGLRFINEFIYLFGSIGIGVIVYGILVIILRVEEINIIINIIKQKINKKNK